MRLLWSFLSAAAVSAFTTTNIIDPDFSIGEQRPVSKDRRTIPGFQIYGAPNLLSDRAILTPGAPGNQRVGVWSKLVNPYDQWSVAAKFRTSGGDRPGGSLSIWYTEKGPAGGSGSGMDSIYNSKPWDGLVLVVDSHAGTGTLRGYLNDGTKDYSVHHNPSSLSFAHCDFDYRNKGYLSEIRLTQGGKSLKVELNDQLCFETQKARLPRGYYFGLTAATSEAPDSFELFNFVVSAPKGAKKYDQAPSPPKIIEAPKKPEHAQQPMKGAGAFKEREPKQEKSQGRAPPPANEFQDWAQEYHQESGEADHEAKYYKSQEEQFSDLHDRLQALTHHLANIQSHLGAMYARLDSLHFKHEEFAAEMKTAQQHAQVVIPPATQEQLKKIENRLDAIENLSVQIAGAITSKDYTHHFEELRNTLKEHHMNLLYSVPESVTQVLASGGPRVGMMVTFVVLVQVGLAVAYVIYKRRRNSSPKKYL